MAEKERIPRLKWSTGYETGIGLLDEQHKKIIQLLNEFASALLQPAPAEELWRLGEEILLHTKAHCADEEELLARHDYPGLGKQRGDHVRAMEKMTASLRLLARNPERGAPEFYRFCAQWFDEHISGPDRAYAEFLIDKGEL